MLFLFSLENLNQQRLFFNSKTIALGLFSDEGCTVNKDAWFPKFRHTTISSLCDLYNDGYKVSLESPS